MGCFCRQIIVPPVPSVPPAPRPATESEPLLDTPPVATPPVDAPPVIAAVSAWLSARWLPSPVPWDPDPAWLEDDPLPTPAMPPQALATIIGLVNARTALVRAAELDPLLPAHQAQLARIVITLNRRLPLLAPLAEDWRPWSALAMLNGQVDTIRSALAAGLFEPAQVQSDEELAASPQSPAQPAYRALLAQLFKLLPVITIVELLQLDPSDPEALDQLAAVIRGLRVAPLPPLADPLLVMRLIARNSAIARLQNSLGTVPYEEMRRQVADKVEEVLAEMPATMPPLLPNPAQVINAPTMVAAKKLSEAFVTGLNWKVPAGVDLPLLTVGAPLAALVSGMAATDVSPIRLAPCDRQCDASRALADWQS